MLPAPEAAESERSIAELAEQGNVDELLTLARTYRAGSAEVPRDLKKCFACYEAAAALGSAEAEHGAGLFYLSEKGSDPFSPLKKYLNHFSGSNQKRGNSPFVSGNDHLRIYNSFQKHQIRLLDSQELDLTAIFRLKLLT